MEYLSRNEKFLESASSNVAPIGSIILDLPPSCIEFVPRQKDEGRIPDDESCFVVGTYDLQKEEDAGEEESASAPKEQSRQGSLSLFKLKGEKL